MVFKLKFYYFLLLSFFFNFISCNVGGLSQGYQYNVSSRTLSLKDSRLRTCVFDPGHSIVYFPQYHDSPSSTQISQEEFELVAKSQFQLLHTLLDYNRSGRSLAVFDEAVSTEIYNPALLERLKTNRDTSSYLIKTDGTIFYLAPQRERVHHLFPQFPAYYEHLNSEQKSILYDLGASLTLYLLGEVSTLYPVASELDDNTIKHQLAGDFSSANLQQNSYWVFDFRETILKTRILNFLNNNPNWAGLVFIVYGKAHVLSDDFSGFSFQSGRHCLGWETDVVEVTTGLF